MTECNRRSPRHSAFLVVVVVAAAVWLRWSVRATAAGDERVCSSVTVRGSGDRLQQSALQNCTVVDGFVQIVLMDATTPKDFDVGYPLLREITQYLVVYRVAGLTSLGRLFPNLTLIRGAYNPTFRGLALMVHDNPNLTDIGLYSLTNITQGFVIISKNPNLCYTSTIDWGQITNGVSSDSNVIMGGSNEALCPGCVNAGCPEDRCWSQRHEGRCQFGKLKGCHPLCAGGCYQHHSARHCFACTAFMYNGECIQECPSSLYGYIRSCVSEDECRSLPVHREESTQDDLNTHFIPFEHICREECPYGFEVTADKRNCKLCRKTKNGHCQWNCNSFKITDEMLNKNNDEYRLHTNCTTIKSLEIEVKYGTSEDVERRLEEYIGKVEVILDQLKIIRSYSLTSLNFLRSLHEIRGENTVNKMALVIRGNKNLQKLWTTKENETRPIKILNGTVSFHYNPKLCISEIHKFGNTSALPAFSDIEVSNISNGDQFACIVYKLHVETVKVLPQSIVLRMLKPAEGNNLGRFMVYYIEATKWNETLESTECEDSSWKIDDITTIDSSRKGQNETEIYHVITSLEPNTEYIYYIKTYTIASKSSMSSMFRSKTLPSKPSSPQNFIAQPTSSSQVELHWKPPSHPHGKLVKYVIKGFHLEDDQKVSGERDYCKNKTFSGDGVTYKSSTASKTLSVNQFCEHQCEGQKRPVDYNMCNTFEHGLDVDLIPTNSRKHVFESCTNFLNIYINEKCLAMQRNDETYFPNSVNENCTETWSVGNIVNDSTTRRDGGDAANFPFELNENVTSYNLTNLRHYSQYVVTILACREVVQEELNSNRPVDACSHETLISFRTLKNNQADRVDDRRIRVDVNNHTVNISWEMPSLVNSIVHSFHLDYKREEDVNFVSECITAREYETAGRAYVIKNKMSSANYQFKIRAVSLAGEGPYTGLHKFTIPDPESAENLNLILMTLVCGFVLVVLTAVIIRTYLSRKLLQHNSLYNLANNLGYVGVYVEDEWELAQEDVVVQKILGRGTFGTVHEGVLMPHNVPCAVKTVSKTNFSRYHAEFMNEAAIMKKFSEGYHIVKLLGVVTKSRPPLLVMELMGRGDLKSVLVKSKDSDDPPPPNRYTMIRMAAQIADGMAFLEYNKFIHRDLAARNCMVADDMTVKIGDFGMSRQIYDSNYYRKGGKGKMPVRWMAPESIGEGIFTSQSDVWSYGVVIWEIMMLGSQPYAGMNNNEVMAHVLDGNLLNLPICCPDVLSGIVKLCWNWTASQRPSFLNIVETLDAYLDDNFRSVSFYHSRARDEDHPPADQSPMSPCTITYEDDVDTEIVSYAGGDTVAVYNAFHVDKNKMSNGHLSPM